MYTGSFSCGIVREILLDYIQCILYRRTWRASVIHTFFMVVLLLGQDLMAGEVNNEDISGAYLAAAAYHIKKNGGLPKSDDKVTVYLVGSSEEVKRLNILLQSSIDGIPGDSIARKAVTCYVPANGQMDAKGGVVISRSNGASIEGQNAIIPLLVFSGEMALTNYSVNLTRDKDGKWTVVKYSRESGS